MRSVLERYWSRRESKRSPHKTKRTSKRGQSKAEKIFIENMLSYRSDWMALRCGYPDFMFYNKKINKAMFFEIKRKDQRIQKNGGLNSNQIEMHEVLGKLGFSVETIYV